MRKTMVILLLIQPRADGAFSARTRRECITAIARNRSEHTNNANSPRS
jgi:hypothetical protein